MVESAFERDFEVVLGPQAIFGRTTPIKCLRAIHRFDNANSVSRWAVFALGRGFWSMVVVVPDGVTREMAASDDAPLLCCRAADTLARAGAYCREKSWLSLAVRPQRTPSKA